VQQTRSDRHTKKAHQVRLALFVLAYNRGKFLRRLALPGSVRHWSLSIIQAKLIRVGAKAIRRGRSCPAIALWPMGNVG